MDFRESGVLLTKWTHCEVGPFTWLIVFIMIRLDTTCSSEIRLILFPWLIIIKIPPLICVFQEIIAAVSASRPRADVAYCIYTLARRLTKTHNWTVTFFFPFFLSTYFLFLINNEMQEGVAFCLPFLPFMEKLSYMTSMLSMSL